MAFLYACMCMYVSMCRTIDTFKAIVPCTTFLVRQRTSTICIGSHDFSDMDIADAEETKSNEGMCQNLHALIPLICLSDKEYSQLVRNFSKIFPSTLLVYYETLNGIYRNFCF